MAPPRRHGWAGPPYRQPLPVPRERNHPRLIAMVMLGLLATIALALFLLARTAERPRATFSIKHIDTASFSHLPDANAQVIIAQTASNAELLKPVSGDQARAANAAIPLATDPGAPAQALSVPFGLNGQNYLRALDCLAAAVYYEAAEEPLDGQRAVAQVVLNRVRHLAYPHTVCGVVFQGSERRTGCQFSFTCDGSLNRTPSAIGWKRARQVAGAALAGLVYRPVGLATHYHADYVLPYWAQTLVKQIVIGRHIFYRWPGMWGKQGAFEARYDPQEPTVRANQQLLATAAEGAGAADAGATGTATMLARPVLMPGKTAKADAPAMERQGDGRAYLVSRDDAPSAPQARPGGITGGVIMPGARIPANRQAAE